MSPVVPLWCHDHILWSHLTPQFLSLKLLSTLKLVGTKEVVLGTEYILLEWVGFLIWLLLLLHEVLLLWLNLHVPRLKLEDGLFGEHGDPCELGLVRGDLHAAIVEVVHEV